MQKTVNLTEVQVRKQLDAMRGVETFEVGVRDAKTGKMMNLEMSGGDVIASLPRLRRENAKGCDVYIRPSPNESHPFVLLDDLGIGTIQRMRQDGIVTVLEVETSPMNYQVWIKLPESLPRADRKAVERLFCERYGADHNSADGMHYGRLSGFTNRKPSRALDDGRSPFCKLSTHRPGAVLPSSIWVGLKAAAEQHQADEIADAAPKAHLPLPLPAQRVGGGVIDFRMAEAGAKRQYSLAAAMWGSSFDPSRADYFIARNLMQRGASQEVARRALQLQSPDLETRKAGHVDDYLERTVQKAYASIPGLAERDQQIAAAAIKSQERRLAERVREEDRQRQRVGQKWEPPKL